MMMNFRNSQHNSVNTDSRFKATYCQACIYDITQNVYFKRFIAFLVLGRILELFTRHTGTSCLLATSLTSRVGLTLLFPVFVVVTSYKSVFRAGMPGTTLP
jgi:hypothetical protein